MRHFDAYVVRGGVVQMVVDAMDLTRDIGNCICVPGKVMMLRLHDVTIYLKHVPGNDFLVLNAAVITL